jgi:hypothetical protein
MRARRFTPAGLEAFRNFVIDARALSRAKQDVPAVPDDLIWGERYSEPLDYELPTEEPRFADKLEIGEFCCRFIPESEHETAREDVCLWSWLAARYFNQITRNRTKIKEPRAYIAGLTFQDFYRHLILGPYFIYFNARDNKARVRVLLYDEPTTMNEVMVQFGSYQTLMQNPEIQEVVQRLYFDYDRGRIKVGAGGKLKGAPRRLMDFFRQIELNFDLVSISADSFWKMLPREFERFMEIKGSAPAT